jgi:hypothetical protein
VLVNGPLEEPVGLRLQNIFDEGHYIHAKWQNRLAAMGVLWGKWQCSRCGHTYFGERPPRCHSCLSGSIGYKEVNLYDDSLMISGHADGWVKDEQGEVLIEIKSVGIGTIRMENPALLASHATLDDAWSNIRHPFPTHIRQGQLYLELIRRMKEEGIYETVPNEIVFIYEKKSDQSYKEFTVRANPSTVKPMLDMAFDIQRAVRVTKVAPACTVDPVNGCKACRAHE